VVYVCVTHMEKNTAVLYATSCLSNNSVIFFSKDILHTIKVIYRCIPLFSPNMHLHVKTAQVLFLSLVIITHMFVLAIHFYCVRVFFYLYANK